jgi:hypothetical protein
MQGSFDTAAVSGAQVQVALLSEKRLNRHMKHVSLANVLL